MLFAKDVPDIRLDFGERIGKHLVCLILLIMHLFNTMIKRESRLRHIEIHININFTYRYIHMTHGSGSVSLMPSIWTFFFSSLL